MNSTLTRRTFLKLIASGGLTIAVSSEGLTAVIRDLGKHQGAAPFMPSAWLNISQDDHVTIYCSQCELGQGVLTCLPMIVAEELEADWERIEVVQAPVAMAYRDPVWESQVTAGSASVKHFYLPLRKAGAQARHMLIAGAADMWKVPGAECMASNGFVLHEKSGRKACYGALAERAARQRPPRHPKLKKESSFRFIGSSLPRLDTPSKVSGTARYGMDVRLPGMLYCVLSRPPRFGSRPARFSSHDALSLPGIKSVFPVDDKIAVTGKSISRVLQARDRLHIQWTEGDMRDLDNCLVTGTLRKALKRRGTLKSDRGDWKGGLAAAHTVHSADYFLPYLAHAQMEPLNCTVFTDGKRCRIWAPCQNQTDIMTAAVDETGLPPDRIDIHITFMGGSFGRRYEVDFVREALKVAKRVKTPVKLFWTREDDFRHDFYRPANAARITAGIDSSGSILAWKHKVAAPSVYERIAPSLLKGGIDPSAVESIHNSAYTFPGLRLEYVWIKQLPPPLGFWRSVGNSHNCFTVESFMDELAARAGMDPLEFRLRNLKDSPRARRVLEVAAEKAGWHRGAKKGQALGICQHYLVYTHIAMTAEVSVDRKNGKIKVHRIVCAVDCGRAVNKAVVREQVEGGILFGLSAALKEEVRFSGGGTVTGNFDDYPVLTMSETPDVEVHLVESGEKPTGVGEVGTAPAAPAVANAVFRAAGTRIRTLPMTPERVLRAIKTGSLADTSANGRHI